MHNAESVPTPACQGWGNGWDGAACFEGWEASPYTRRPIEPKRPCPACKTRVETKERPASGSNGRLHTVGADEAVTPSYPPHRCANDCIHGRVTTPGLGTDS